MSFTKSICVAGFTVLALPLASPAWAKDKEPAAGKANTVSKPSSSAGDSSSKSEKPAVDPKLPEYESKGKIDGRLKSVGSDTMNDLMAYWSQDFAAVYPDVRVETEGKGSGTAIPAIIQGTADLGPMSRDITKQESAEFKAKFGYDPTQVKTAIDMLAVFVHKDNPIESLSFEQLDAIFSVARKARLRKRDPHLGRIGADRRLGQKADQPVRPRSGLGHVRLFQGTCAGKGRLQAHRQIIAGQFGGRAGRGERPVRHRL